MQWREKQAWWRWNNWLDTCENLSQLTAAICHSEPGAWDCKCNGIVPLPSYLIDRNGLRQNAKRGNGTIPLHLQSQAPGSEWDCTVAELSHRQEWITAKRQTRPQSGGSLSSGHI